MKTDYREVWKEIPFPVFDVIGVPTAYTGEELMEMYQEGQITFIVCQRCLEPFLVQWDFGGDPPYHDGHDGLPCVGNTMLCLTEDDIGYTAPYYAGGDEFELISQEEWDRIKANLLLAFTRLLRQEASE